MGRLFPVPHGHRPVQRSARASHGKEQRSDARDALTALLLADTGSHASAVGGKCPRRHEGRSRLPDPRGTCKSPKPRIGACRLAANGRGDAEVSAGARRAVALPRGPSRAPDAAASRAMQRRWRRHCLTRGAGARAGWPDHRSQTCLAVGTCISPATITRPVERGSRVRAAAVAAQTGRCHSGDALAARWGTRTGLGG